MHSPPRDNRLFVQIKLFPPDQDCPEQDAVHNNDHHHDSGILKEVCLLNSQALAS